MTDPERGGDHGVDTELDRQVSEIFYHLVEKSFIHSDGTIDTGVTAKQIGIYRDVHLAGVIFPKAIRAFCGLSDADRKAVYDYYAGIIDQQRKGRAKPAGPSSNPVLGAVVDLAKRVRATRETAE